MFFLVRESSLLCHQAREDQPLCGDILSLLARSPRPSTSTTATWLYVTFFIRPRLFRLGRKNPPAPFSSLPHPPGRALRALSRSLSPFSSSSSSFSPGAFEDLKKRTAEIPPHFLPTPGEEEERSEQQPARENQDSGRQSPPFPLLPPWLGCPPFSSK